MEQQDLDRRGIVRETDAAILDLRREFLSHMATEEKREAKRDEREIERDRILLRLTEDHARFAGEHAELMREWRDVQEKRRRNSEVWAKVRASVIGWAIIGILAWLLNIGASVAEKVLAAAAHLTSTGK